MNAIEVNGLTKDYGHGRGIFEVSFAVQKGEVFGFLGPNGAGKSTTMRHLMGFSKPQKGKSVINGMDCWRDHAKIMQNVGYIPGEVALPEGLTDKGFLDMMRKLRNSNANRTAELLQLFEVKTGSSLKRMSIGEKRKLAIVSSFMSDPDILLLDEPTSGLDPVGQEIFIDFVKREKANGKTVLLSSHIFSEVEALCDRIAIIKDGRIVSVVNAEEVKHYKRKTFEVSFTNKADYERFANEDFEIREKFPKELRYAVAVENPQCDHFIKTIASYKVAFFSERQQTLEDYFMHFYKNDRTFGGVANGKRKQH